MAKFNVMVTRDVTESAWVDVEAGGIEEAKAKALEEASNAPGNFDWAPDDFSGGDPYLADPDECAELAVEVEEAAEQTD